MYRILKWGRRVALSNHILDPYKKACIMHQYLKGSERIGQVGHCVGDDAELSESVGVSCIASKREERYWDD
jgi:hypothetical protein